MKKQITYTEPEKQFDEDGNPLPDVHRSYTVVATTEAEMAAIDASIRDPSRGITDISEWEDVPLTAEELLAKNSETCRDILVNGFKSAIKGDGLQPYRMNEDDQKNVLGYIGMITLGLMQDPTGASIPMFEWKNATQVKCEPDWSYPQILGLFQGYGAWKAAVLKRQDEIKERILGAKTDEELVALAIDYGDLLEFE